MLQLFVVIRLLYMRLFFPRSSRFQNTMQDLRRRFWGFDWRRWVCLPRHALDLHSRCHHRRYRWCSQRGAAHKWRVSRARALEAFLRSVTCEMENRSGRRPHSLRRPVAVEAGRVVCETRVPRCRGTGRLTRQIFRAVACCRFGMRA
jgi:hypothetical protein